jgi:integrase
MKLTDKLIKKGLAAGVPRGKTYRALTDGKRLFLRIDTAGGASWRLKYTVGGRESQTSLGAYPGVSIAAARDLAEDVRKQARAGKNLPRLKRDAEETKREKAALTFGAVGAEWLAHDDTRARRTQSKHAWLFEQLKRLHSMPLGEVKPSDVRAVLKTIETKSDRRETAHRAGQVAAQVFDYAISAHDFTGGNPAARRKGWLKPKKPKRPSGHLPGITEPPKVGMLLKMIDFQEDAGRALKPTVMNAMRFLARVFVRQEALCGAQWSEFHHLDDPAQAEWRIPAARMKGPIGERRPFTVPLPRQAIEILKAQRDFSGESRFVFPHALRLSRGMSSGALNAALGAMGYESSEHTPHGFRTTAATLLREKPLAFDSDLVELALAHRQGDKVRGAYDRAARFEERREMMQAYADYLDKLKMQR